MSEVERHVEGFHYTWGTRPKRLADKRSIHANRVRLRQFSRKLVQDALEEIELEESEV